MFKNPSVVRAFESALNGDPEAAMWVAGERAFMGGNKEIKKVGKNFRIWGTKNI